MNEQIPDRSTIFGIYINIFAVSYVEYDRYSQALPFLQSYFLGKF